MSAFGGKADMAFCGKFAFAVAIESKADIGCCTAYVRLWPKADIIGRWDCSPRYYWHHEL